jgi:site-specific recombinase XerD
MPATAEKSQSLAGAVRTYLFDVQAAGRSPGTVQTYRYALNGLRAFLEGQDVDDWAAVGAAELRQFFASRLASLKPNTIRTRAIIISSFFKWLLQEGLVTCNPMEHVRRPKSPQRRVKAFTSEAELLAMFRAAEETRDPMRNRAILYVLLDCGLRASELLSMAPLDYNPETNCLTVKGKGNKVRMLHMGVQCRNAFEALLARAEDDLWGIGRVELQQLIRRMGQRAGVKAHPHKFRHTFAMRFLDAGGTIDELQYLMGHSHISTTMIYAVAGQEQRALRSQAQHSPLDGLF